MKKIIFFIIILCFNAFGDVNDDLTNAIKKENISSVKKFYHMGATISYGTLKEAILSKNNEIVSFLLTDKKNKSLLTPEFFDDIANEDIESLRFLIKFYKFTNPANNAIVNKDMKALEKLFLKKPYNKFYLNGFNNNITQEIHPLSLAIILDYKEFIDFFIKKGAEASFYDSPHFEDNTNLSIFSGSRYVLSTFWLAIKANNYNFLKYLISKGANVNVYSEGSDISTPLLYAIENDNEELVKFLIDNGAFTNIKIERIQEHKNIFFGAYKEDNPPEFDSYLSIALEKNNEKIIDMLMSKNTRIEPTDINLALDYDNYDFIVKYAKGVPLSDKFLFQLINTPKNISTALIDNQSIDKIEEYLPLIIINCNNDIVKLTVKRITQEGSLGYNTINTLINYDYLDLAQFSLLSLYNSGININFLLKEFFEKQIPIPIEIINNLLNYTNDTLNQLINESLPYSEIEETLSSLLMFSMEYDNKPYFDMLINSKLLSQDSINKLFLYSILKTDKYYFNILKKMNPRIDNDFIINNLSKSLTEESLKNLREYGFDISNTDKKHNTLLTQELKKISPTRYFSYDKSSVLDYINLLLKNGVNPNIKADDDIYPIFRASDTNSIELLKLLKNYNADFKVLDDDKESILFTPIKINNYTMVKYIIEMEPSLTNTTNKDGITPLDIASYNNFEDIVELLISNGADLNLQDNNGYSPLLYAIENYSYETVELLVNNGANLNSKTVNRITPLMKIAYLGQDSLFDLLIKYKIDIDAVDKNGLSALTYACAKGNEKITEKLIKLGTNLEVKTANGYSPLLLALNNDQYNVAKLLINHGANVNSSSSDGWTPLKEIIYKDNLDLLNIILKKDTKINIKDTVFPSIAAYNNSYKILNYLIKNKIDVNLKNSDGESLLMLAAKNNSKDTAKLLIQNGANKRDKNYNNQGILEVAGSTDMRTFLMSLGVTW